MAEIFQNQRSVFEQTIMTFTRKLKGENREKNEFKYSDLTMQGRDDRTVL